MKYEGLMGFKLNYNYCFLGIKWRGNKEDHNIIYTDLFIKNYKMIRCNYVRISPLLICVYTMLCSFSTHFYFFLREKKSICVCVCMCVKIELGTFPEIESLCYRVGLLRELLNQL